MSSLRIAAIALLAPLLSVPGAIAQVYTGQITGVVQDQGDALVAGAEVKAINKQNGVAFTTRSGNDGCIACWPSSGEYSLNVACARL